MSLRKIVLFGIAIAAIGIVSAILLSSFPTQDDSAVQTKIEKLVQDYDDVVYLGADYKAAEKIANEILSLASQTDEPQAVEVRGLIRIAFASLACGKWHKGWKKHVETCEQIVTKEPTVERAEFLLYSSLMKAKWQHKFAEGLKQAQEAVWIASHINDDRTLALAHVHSSEIHGFQGQANLVVMNGYQGVDVAEHLGREPIKARALQTLIAYLIFLENYSEAADCGERMLEILPNSVDAKYALFMDGRSDEFEKYVMGLVEQIEKGPKGPKRRGSGRSLLRLGVGYLVRKEFAKCRELSELAIPKLEAAGDKTSLAACINILRLARLELADDVGEIDEVAESYTEKAAFPSIHVAESIAAAYAKLNEKEKSFHWKELAYERRKQDSIRDLGYLRQSSKLDWESQLRSRQQMAANNQIAAESREARRRVWGLSSALILGLTVCALLSGFYFLLRRERNSLEDLVETRTMSLSKAMQDASAADRAKSDFLAQINHEIRNPLTAILGYCELLSSGHGNSHEMVSGIESSSLHLRGLVDKILEVSKIESSGLELKAAEFFPKQTANDIHGIMTEQATQRGLRFECQFIGDHKSSVLSDETKIRQIALNLIGNAIKFTEEGSVIGSFELKEPDDCSNGELVISVKDTGTGIAEDETRVVFDHFTKASNGTARDGSGLGLFITSKLVNCLGGEILLDSELGVGTQVKVTLPVKITNRLLGCSAPTNNNAPIESENLSATPDKRVLVVDDQEMIRTTTRLQLEACGLECETTQELDRTIELVESWQPDLVLLDLRMPDHSGFEVFEEIRRSTNPLVLIYAMTGDATAEVQQKCLRLGFDGFITKPFKVGTILDVLKTQDTADESLQVGPLRTRLGSAVQARRVPS